MSLQSFKGKVWSAVWRLPSSPRAFENIGAQTQIQKPALTSQRVSIRSYHRSITSRWTDHTKVKITHAMNKGDVNAVREAYKRTKETKESPIKSNLRRDFMDEILDSAMPNRAVDSTSKLGETPVVEDTSAPGIAGESLDGRNPSRFRYVDEEYSEVVEQESTPGFGTDDPVVVPQEVFDLNAQAQYLFVKEEYHEALECLEQSLKIVKDVMGARHIEIATILVSMSQVHEKLKNFDLAETLLKQAIEIRKEVDGPIHTSVATAFNKLAHVQTVQKNYESALKSSKHAQRIIEAALRDSEAQLSYYKNHNMKNPQDLEAQVYALTTEKGQILNTRGAIHFKQNNFPGAVEDWKAAIEVWTKLLEKSESPLPPIYAAFRNLAYLYRVTDNIVSNIKVGEDFLALVKKYYPSSPMLPTAYFFAAQLNEQNNLIGEAYSFATKAHEASTKFGKSEDTIEYHEMVERLMRKAARREVLEEGEEELEEEEEERR